MVAAATGRRTGQLSNDQKGAAEGNGRKEGNVQWPGEDGQGTSTTKGQVVEMKKKYNKGQYTKLRGKNLSKEPPLFNLKLG
jgi:hypothetical protein